MKDPISSYLSADHRRCDHLLAACEAAVSAAAWAAADECATGVRHALQRHFDLEEEMLFPAVERASPAAAGPTGVMRTEHRQMRYVLDELTSAVRARDRAACLGNLESLHMLGQQHNAKEEGILYPLADDALRDSAEALVGRMRAV
jgi:iron-sulfur cluster repair protein YtfE (RIC family)